MTLFLEYGIVWISLAMIVPLILAVLGITYDYRFFILILIWIFIIIPISFFLLFVVYGMQPLTTYNTIKHTITINNKEINIKLIIEEGEDFKSKEISLDYTFLEKVKTSTDSFILFFKKPLAGIIVIPFNSLGNNEHIDNILRKLKR